MKAMTEKTVDWRVIHRRLDAVRMSEYDRRQARESLRNAEMIVELVLPLVNAIGSIGRAIEHAALGTAHGIKAIFAKPVKH